ncbi:sugar kinase [Sporosarcina sp. Marseille-Q4063]|uniref:sugar kinase n=1 Tax=Sporosarcina sp. Marseille-Q4063 TaxID=2810514 RepID=UPI001BAEF901|nr:sugar kinase [Sporosarcina sp. Marseille-Q4063]QUW21561.1 sugar kinase [Sporosarcina sp. Marseille-Q4063]
MKKIITFGEILLRLSTTVGERLLQANQLTMNYGGAEANVAISLANFGHDVNMVSKIPDNSLGHAVEKHLKANGVRTDYLLKGGERLGTYYLETGIGERSAQVVYDRKYSSISMLAENEIDFDEIFRDATLFHVTGITPALSPALSEITLLALKKAKELGVTTSFDFNYRSKLWGKEEAAEVFKQLLPYVDICSCGDKDAIHFLGIEEADETLEASEKLSYYYAKIQEMYPNITYLSSTFREVLSASENDLQGNFYVDGILYQSKVHHINPIVDRVGGGDAFASGILHGILEGFSPEEVISFATAASALKHTVHGDCNVFSADEVLAFAENGTGKIIR